MPIVVIDIFGESVTEEDKLFYAVFIDTNGSGRASVSDTPDFAGHCGLKIRGNSSTFFEKKQYSFESWDEDNEEIDASILGLPADSDWILQDDVT
jgi:hypothetical protein